MGFYQVLQGPLRSFDDARFCSYRSHKRSFPGSAHAYDRNAKEIGEADFGRAVESFQDEWQEFLVVEVIDAVFTDPLSKENRPVVTDCSSSLQPRLAPSGKETLQHRWIFTGAVLQQCKRIIGVHPQHFCHLRPRLLLPPQ